MTIDEMREKAAKLVFGQIDIPDQFGKFWNVTSIVKGSIVDYCFEHNGLIIFFTHNTKTNTYIISDNRNYYFYIRNDTDQCNDYDFYIHFGIDGSDDTEYCGNIVFDKYNISPEFNAAAENMYEPPSNIDTKEKLISFLISKGIRYESQYDYTSD